MKIFGAAAVSSFVLLSACAGGGGGGGVGPPIAAAPASTPPSGGVPFGGTVAVNPPLPINPSAFTQFPLNSPNGATSIAGIGQSTTVIDYFSTGPSWTPVVTSGQTLVLGPASPGVAGAWVQTPTHLLAIQPLDHPIPVTLAPGTSASLPVTYVGSPYTVLDSIRLTAYADAAALGWTYQTFGWWYDRDDSTGSAAFITGSYSVGAATPGSAIPTNGAATFTGVLGGEFYARSAGLFLNEVSAPMSLTVNFAARSADFSSGDWVSGSTVRPGTALSGLLTYGAGLNALSGTLTSANGHWAGPAIAQFYGPAAQEVGGAFTLAPTDGSIDRVTGGFGAKR